MYHQARKLAGYSLLVMAGFVASRVLGLVRNVVVAQQFGTGREYEAFIAALVIPDLVFQVLAGGAVGSAFIPVFKGYFARDDDAGAWRLTSRVMSLALVVTAPISLLLALFSRPLTEIVVPGWDAESKELTATLMRTMLISPAIFAVSGFAISVLNSFQRFVLTALAPILYNASIIVSALVFRHLGIEGVAIGAVAGALLHLLIQVPGLIDVGMRYRFGLSLKDPGVREVLRLMGPRMIGLGVVQVNQLVNVVLASYLLIGSLGYLNVAWLMVMTPLVLAMAVSTAVFPTMAEESARDHSEAVGEVFVLSLRTILFLTIPMAVGLVTLGEPLIRLLFERGEFTAVSTERTHFALTFYAIGLAGHATVEIVDRVYYALHDTWTPVKAASLAFILNLVLGLSLMWSPLNYGGLALANSLAALAEAALLLSIIRRRIPSLDLVPVLKSLARTVVASLLMGLTVAMLPQLLQDRLALPSTVELTLVVLFVGISGGMVYFVFSYLLQSEELRVLLRLARARG
ncbi:MAG: murein biosynthesis integral membrane protein MurJ [Chloroflexi bacterium]|nr:murein biosynthesis integral membrane protein MurJ [Chloroflexota bacterium]